MAGDSSSSSSTPIDIFKVGYNGWVKIKKHLSGTSYYNGVFPTDGTMLQVTSASLTRQRNLPTVTSYYLPFNDNTNDAKSQILLGLGTYNFSGELSFELTNGSLKEFLNDDFLKRNSFFSMSFFDGERGCKTTNCVWSNIQIQCSPGNLVNVSMSYLCNNGYRDDFQIIDSDENNELTYDETDLLVPYWTCGHDEFQEFSIGFERSVTPVYLNGDLNVASYLRPGLVTINLSATTIEQVDAWDSIMDIHFGTNHGIRLLKSRLISSQYNMSSMSDTGAKTYTWQSLSTDAAVKPFELYNN